MTGLYRQLVAAPPGTPFDLTVGEVELAEEVAAYVAERTRVRVRRVAIRLCSDHVEATVELKLGLFWSTVSGAGRVWANGGTVDFRIDALRMGEVYAPAFLRTQVVDYARRIVHPAHMPVEVDVLEVRAGQLRAAGRTKLHVLP